MLVLGIALAALSAAAAHADGLEREYLKQLRETGYADWAIEFIEIRQAAKRLPGELAETFELELADCYRAQAESSTSLDAIERKLDQADGLLRKFLVRRAAHAAAADARAAQADVALLRGRLFVRMAQSTGAADRKREFLDKARAHLERAETAFGVLLGSLNQRLAALAEIEIEAQPKAKKTGKRAMRARASTPSERDALEGQRVDLEFKRAQAHYLAAQTFADPADAGRKERLAAAAVAFDAIYQRYRTAEVGLYAHMWHGKIEDELGNLQAALDIYDEVLVNAPEGGARTRVAGLDALFAQVEQFRLAVVARQGKRAKFAAESSDWLKKNRAARATAGYQGIALAYAKSLLETEEAASVAERRRRAIEGLRLLDEVARTPSEHQSEAILLARKHRSAAVVAPSEIASFDEAVAVGDSLAAANDHVQAQAAYARALELAGPQADAARVASVRYRLAVAQFGAARLDDAFATAAAVAKENAKTPSAPPAAALATTIAYAKYAKAPSPGNLKQLREAADWAIAGWPDRAEADDARLHLARALAHARDFPAAVELAERVDAKSPVRNAALQLAGLAAWQQHRIAKTSTGQVASAVDWGRRAEAAAQQCLAALDRQSQTNAAPARPWIETRALLAEIHEDRKETAKAAALLKPVVDAIAADAKSPLDAALLAVLAQAARIELAVGNAAGGERIWKLAAERGGDRADVNAMLAQIAHGIVAQSRQPNAPTDQLKARLQPLLTTLANRKQIANPAAVGDCFEAIGDDANARTMYLRAVAGKSANDAASLGIRLRLARLLRKEGRHAEALEQANAVAAAFPRWLEPQLEKGEILKAAGEKDADRLAEAVALFTRLRTQLARSPQRPAEYYDVVFNAAHCLALQAKQTGDPTRRTQAIQLLKSTMTLSPQLNGEETRKRYQALLDSLVAARTAG